MMNQNTIGIVAGLGLVGGAAYLGRSRESLGATIRPLQPLPVPGCVVVVEDNYGARKVFPFSRKGLVDSQDFGKRLGRGGRLGLGMIRCERGTAPIFQCSTRWDQTKRKYGPSYCSLDLVGGSNEPLTGQMRGDSLRKTKKLLERERKASWVDRSPAEREYFRKLGLRR